MILSIHQPNFMPWRPFFEKISQSDMFVIMGHCQYEKNGFQNRFNMNKKWYTMSTARGLVPIVDKRYVNHKKDWSSIKARLPEYHEQLNIFDDCIEESLYETNFNIIVKASKALGIGTQIVRDFKTDLTSTDRLVSICKHFGADTYLSGPSGKRYIEVDKFKREGIEIVYQAQVAGGTLLQELEDVI